MRSRRIGRDRGAATAELAMVLPLLVAVTFGLVWLISVAAQQVRIVDAARETARAVARGDDPAAAVSRGEQAGPTGTRVTVTSSGGDITARAVADVAGPGGVFRWLPGVYLHASAVAEAETS